MVTTRISTESTMPVILHMICSQVSRKHTAHFSPKLHSLCFTGFLSRIFQRLLLLIKIIFIGFQRVKNHLVSGCNQSSPHQLLRILIGKGNLDAPTASNGYLTSADACRKLELCDCIMFIYIVYFDYFASKIFNGLISGSLAGAPCYT